MSTITSSPFQIHAVTFENSSSTSKSIFDDVEAAKLRLIEMRRASKRRLEGSSHSVRPSQQTGVNNSASAENRNQQALSTITRSLLEADTQLSEVKAVQVALTSRRAEIQELMRGLKLQIKELRTQSDTIPAGAELTDDQAMKERDVDILEAPLSPKSAPVKKRQRYFEQASAPAASRSREVDRVRPMDDDLSSVVCPFELLGTCTDPSCPHMHLSR